MKRTILLMTAATIIFLSGCMDEKYPKRYFLIGFTVEQYGLYTVNSFFHEGGVGDMEYYKKVVVDAYKCDNVEIGMDNVKILSVSEMNEDDFKFFKGSTNWPEICKPDSAMKANIYSGDGALGSPSSVTLSSSSYRLD